MNTHSKQDNQSAQEPDEASTQQPAGPGAERRDDAIASLQADLDSFRELALRSQADLDNYRKRAAREREQAIKFANAELLEKLLPVIDNFALGLQAADESTADEARVIGDGLRMVLRQLQDVLADYGVEEIATSGELFDPNRHEAVAQEASDEVPEGRIIRELRKGYVFRDRLLRAANVVVSSGAGGN